MGCISSELKRDDWEGVEDCGGDLKKNMKSVEEQIQTPLFQNKSGYQRQLALDRFERSLDMFI